jgi:SAM-dependent methyltransferase/uncharacterized protein YbaR (Trm112 family)
MNDWLLNLLACPRDKEPLMFADGRLKCGNGHEYPIVDGIPVLLLDDVQQTGWWSEMSLQKARASDNGDTAHAAQPPVSNRGGISDHVQQVVAATCGNLYEHLVGKLETYPIPELRLPDGNGKVLLDIGCNWGRWSIAAARKGYRVIGLDPNLDAVIAARQIAAELGVTCEFVVGDARYLPFKAQSFDVVFSYSVIQHLSKGDAKQTLACIASVLEFDGFSFVQMPNRFGLRSTYHLAKRGFSEGENFDVRYWSPTELKRAFEEAVGPTKLSVDGFFGLGIQPSDARILPIRFKVVLGASEALRKLSQRFPLLTNMADSLYVTSRVEHDQAIN